MPTPLSPKRRSELRAEAHKLHPTVIIGDKGLTEEVLAETDRSLKAHELIKVRAATDDRDARNVWMESICENLDAHPIQQIGKILVVYRENPEKKPAKPPVREPQRTSRRARPAPVPRTPSARGPRPAGTRAKARTNAAPSTSRRRTRRGV